MRSRIGPEESSQPAPAPVFQEVEGTSGIIGGTGDGVDRYRIASTKTLEYRSAANDAARNDVDSLSLP